MTSSSRRAPMAALALVLLLAIAIVSSPALAASSTAVSTAAAQGTPVVPPPPPPKPKPLTCTISKKITRCSKRSPIVCATRAGTKTCRYQTARCRLDRRTKRCAISTVRCTTKSKRTRCVVTFRKNTVNKAFAVLLSQAIPRFLARPASIGAGRTAAAAAVKLISSRPGTPAAGPLVPVATSEQPRAGGIGAGIGALILAFVLMSIMLVRRRPRRG